MNWFKNSSIRGKLIAIQLLTTLAGLALYGAFTVINETHLHSAAMTRKSETLVKMIATNCTSPLDFQDVSAAEEILSSAVADEDVVNAWIYDAAGVLFATYSRPDSTEFHFPSMKAGIYRLEQGFLTVSKEIARRGETIGVVSVRLNVRYLRTAVVRSGGIAALVLVIGMGVSLFLSIFLQRAISTPIHALVGVVRKVSETGDYSIRTGNKRNDEIGVLCDGFDAMLQKIQQREDEKNNAAATLRESEVRYRGLFEDCPTSLWEEDFSEVKRYIDELRRSGITDLRAYFTNHRDAIRQCADLIKVLDVNRATLDLLQYDRREDLCAHLSKVFHEESYALLMEELVFLAAGNAVFQTETINRNRHGEKLHVNMTVAIVPGHEETWSRVFVSLTDISSRVRAEEELRRLNQDLETRIEERTAELALAKERAESADRLKSAFLAAMSHELRTPLNSIIGFTGIVLQGIPGPLNEEQTKQLGMVQRSARHLLDLINDVLDLSKIEAGQLEVESKPFNAAESIEKVIHLVLPLAEKKGLALSVNISPDVGELTSDRRRFEQILINLINNGIKFTEEGHVRVECMVEDKTLVTRVVDTGIGIKPEDTGKLFQAFQQVDVGLSRNHEGTGLGLSICKRLVEKLGGRIWVESEWHVGSVFTFTLPIA
ncbi:MAG TPA: ATP-binding protein [Candidatus Hydrogenedentes bacterium]|nr:ATP-binding protein [Candidatus Hydrogenedentota bacterium]